MASFAYLPYNNLQLWNKISMERIQAYKFLLKKTNFFVVVFFYIIGNAMRLLLKQSERLALGHLPRLSCTLIPQARQHAEATMSVYQYAPTDFPTLVTVDIRKLGTVLAGLKVMVSHEAAGINFFYLEGR